MIRLTIIFFLLSFSFWSYSSNISIPVAELSRFETGDVLIRKGEGALSYQLMNATKEDFSHCAFIERKGEELFLIESNSCENDSINGIRRIPLAETLKHVQDSMLMVFRPVVSGVSNIELVETAINFMNNKKPFDYGFKLNEDEKFYCFELLIHCFIAQTNQEIFLYKFKEKVVFPLFASFFDESKFDLIYSLRPIK